MIEYFMTKEQIQAFLDRNQLKVLSRVTLSVPLSDRILCIDNFDILHRDTFKRAFAILRVAIRKFHWRWGSTSSSWLFSTEMALSTNHIRRNTHELLLMAKIYAARVDLCAMQHFYAEWRFLLSSLDISEEHESHVHRLSVHDMTP